MLITSLHQSILKILLMIRKDSCLLSLFQVMGEWIFYGYMFQISNNKAAWAPVSRSLSSISAEGWKGLVG